jgi:hypothetical protein
MKQSEILELLDAQEINPNGNRNFRDIPYCWERVRELVLNSLWLDAVKDPPKENGDYLVTIQPPENGKPFTTRDFFEGGKFAYGEYVVAWREMPEPYLPPERSAE